jgi:hypothetical protein
MAVQSIGKVVASELATPKRDVKNRVALNAALRPMRSEPAGEEFYVLSAERYMNLQVPHPTAPNIMPANIVEDKRPIRLSGTG